jgi:hypothetical protein
MTRLKYWKAYHWEQSQWEIGMITKSWNKDLLWLRWLGRDFVVTGETTLLTGWNLGFMRETK